MTTETTEMETKTSWEHARGPSGQSCELK